MKEFVNMTGMITDILWRSKLSVENYLYQLVYIIMASVWVPHQLNEANFAQQISICDLLQKPILKRLVTRDRKWIVCNNVKCKQINGEETQWLTTSTLQSRTSPENGYAFNFVQLERCWLLQASSYRQDNECSVTSSGHIKSSHPAQASKHLLIIRALYFINARPHTSLQMQQKLPCASRIFTYFGLFKIHRLDRLLALKRM